MIQHSSERPNRTAVAVIRAHVLQPITLIIHEISKAFVLSIEGKAEECEIAGRKIHALTVIQFSQENTDQEGTRVVVGSVSVRIVRHGEVSMLQNASLIRHRPQVT